MPNALNSNNKNSTSNVYNSKMSSQQYFDQMYNKYIHLLYITTKMLSTNDLLHCTCLT